MVALNSQPLVIPSPMNPIETQSETARAALKSQGFFTEIVHRQLVPDRHLCWRLCDKQGRQIGEFCATEDEAWMQYELTALKSPELPGDAKALVDDLVEELASQNFGGILTKAELASILEDLATELHAQHQRETEEKCKYYHDNLEQYRQREIGFVHTVEKQKREIAALREENERLKLEKSRTSTHAHKGCDPTCQECT
jgi:hypothetical protein